VEQIGHQANRVTSRDTYDSLNTPGEWAVVFLVMFISFIFTWFAIQAFYTPTPRSESPSILKMYESQGCVRSPDFIPANLVIWQKDRIKYVPFDDNWTTYQIVLFCP
jgi:hypothetical protein